MDLGLSSVVFATSIAALLLLGVYRGVYNVFFHPLSKFPGPWWMAASDLPRLWKTIQGRFVADSHALHQRYGPVVRVGPKELSYIEPQAWKDIYGHNRVELAKDPGFYGELPNGVPHIGTANHSPVNFYRPDDFCPERWLDTGAPFDKDRRDASQPFSFGPRNCIDKHLAHYQSRLLFCMTLLNYDMELCPESQDWMEGQKVWITWRKPPMWVKLTPVEKAPLR